MNDPRFPSSAPTSPAVSPDTRSRVWRRRAGAIAALAAVGLAAPLTFNSLTSQSAVAASPTAAVTAAQPLEQAARSTTATPGPDGAGAPRMVLPDFADLVERVGPAVVNIRSMVSTSPSRMGMPGLPGGIDPQLEEFFRRFGIPFPGGRQPGPPRRGGPDEDGEPQQRGVGSGFILSADGLVMTNAHVVDGADELIVTLTDKREFKAKVVGLDKRTDVAVLKIDAGANLPTIKVGDVGRLRVGEWVLAIGSPFNLDNTVTAGIVSAKARDTGDYLPFIQTDVAINPGNSGGPLINMKGEVVGINSQIYSRSGGFMGISFAIPIDEAMRVADQLKAHGRVIRGRIGVAIGPVSKEVAESIGLGKATGAQVTGVEKGGPAEKAGLEPGDIITKVDGKTIEGPTELSRAIGAIKPGSKAAVTVFRLGKTREFQVGVAEFEADTPTRAGKSQGGKDDPGAARSALGVGVTDLTAAQKDQLRVKHGVRVTSVEGAAARSGLREGDVILAVDNTEIQDAAQFAQVAGKAEKQRAVSVLVRRGDSVNFLVIRR